MRENPIMVIVCGLLVTVLGGVLLSEYQRSQDRHDEEQLAQPKLKLQEIRAHGDYVDVFVTSESNRPFTVHGYLFRAQAFLVHPLASTEPDRIGPEDAPKPRRKPWLRRRIFLREQECGAPIEPDDIVISPPSLKLNEWIEGEVDPFEVKPFENKRIRIQICNEHSAGAKCLIDAIVVFGNNSDPQYLHIGNLEIDVIAKSEVADGHGS